MQPKGTYIFSHHEQGSGLDSVWCHVLAHSSNVNAACHVCRSLFIGVYPVCSVESCVCSSTIYLRSCQCLFAPDGKQLLHWHWSRVLLAALPVIHMFPGTMIFALSLKETNSRVGIIPAAVAAHQAA